MMSPTLWLRLDESLNSVNNQTSIVNARRLSQTLLQVYSLLSSPGSPWIYELFSARPADACFTKTVRLKLNFSDFTVRMTTQTEVSNSHYSFLTI